MALYLCCNLASFIPKFQLFSIRLVYIFCYIYVPNIDPTCSNVYRNTCYTFHLCNVLLQSHDIEFYFHSMMTTNVRGKFVTKVAISFTQKIMLVMFVNLVNYLFIYVMPYLPSCYNCYILVK